MIIWNDEMTCCIGFVSQYPYKNEFIAAARLQHEANTGEGLDVFTLKTMRLPDTKVTRCASFLTGKTCE